MRKCKFVFIVLLSGIGFTPVNGQITSSSNYLIAQPVPDRTVSYSVTNAGVAKPIFWGLDLAWLSESNIKRGIAFMGADRVDVVRASFQPTLPLVNGDLQAAQITDLNNRLNLIDLTGTKTKVALNCDHPSVNSWYIGNAANWAALIDATTKRVQNRGRTVISVAPFNEPDYGWGQFSGSNGQLDFYNICGELRKNTRFDSIRLCGGNTLNCDQSLPWYNYLKGRLDEGNTHQLAGSFDNYANFFTTVRANGDHATADELHNVMEAMVGVEYGMQTGIWWGTAEYARGEFVKASDGMRLGYAEHRPNWTAASVYRGLDGKVQAFGGTSERQAATTTYRFVSKDRDVYYDGYGPQREYTMVLPGGTGYQVGQTNAERVVNINWGDDIQPVINGRYILVNRNSGKVMEVASGATNAGANVRQNTYIDKTYQQWNVIPVDSRVGGDYSYFTITAVHSAKSLDIYNFSLENGGNIVVWDDAKNANQQWYLEYAENGWFYIRSRHSAKCIEVANSSTAAGANIQQKDLNYGTNQQWRFLPVGTPIEFVSPAAPINLVATPNAASIRLDWSVSTETDVEGYTIYRSEQTGGPYNTIARNVKTSAFVDNTTLTGKQYFYTVRAVDNSLNRSEYSNEANASSTGNNELIAHYKFETNTLDSTINLNHSATFGTPTYVDGKSGAKSISLSGTNTFLQLPSNIANQKEMTIAAWVYLKGTSAWQRIFDFGNDQNQYMFLTPRSNTAQLRFSIKNGGAEQSLNAAALPFFNWSHVAVTLSASGARMYVNGVQVAESNTITINPLDFKPILNYIGRSQYTTDPLFNGMIDDFRVYNYALSANEVTKISEVLSKVENIDYDNNFMIWPNPANNILNVRLTTENKYNQSKLEIINMDGRLVLSKNINQNSDFNIDVLNIPSGIYTLQLTNEKIRSIKKLIIKH